MGTNACFSSGSVCLKIPAVRLVLFPNYDSDGFVSLSNLANLSLVCFGIITVLMSFLTLSGAGYTNFVSCFLLL